MKWNWDQYGNVEVIQHHTGRLMLRRAHAKSVPANVFGENDLADLFASVRDSKLDLACDSFAIYGEEMNERGTHPLALPGAKLKENGYGLAYEPFQLQPSHCKPVRFQMSVFFSKPQLAIYTTDWQPEPRGKRAAAPRPVLALKRVSATAKPQGRNKA